MLDNFMVINIYNLNKDAEIDSIRNKKDLSSVVKNISKIIKEGTIAQRNTEPIDTLILPIPNNISDDISHNYNKGGSHNIEYNIVKSGIDLLPTTTESKSKITKGSVGASKGVKGLFGWFESHMKRTAYSINPNIQYRYEYTNPRSFSFTFIIMPKNKYEADYYIKNIEKLKKYSKATEINNIIPMLSQDNLVTWELGGNKFGENSFINELYKSNENSSGFFITNISNSIDTDGYQNKFKDDTPKKMTLTLNLVERKPLFEDYWRDKNE